MIERQYALRVFAHTGSRWFSARVGQVGAPALAGWVAELYEGSARF